jgi:GyrI-like small molecule binding domain
VLARVRQQLQAEIERRQASLAALERLLAEGVPRVRGELRREPSKRVCTTSEAAAPETIGRVTSACVARLLETVRLAGQPVAAPLIGVFPLDFGAVFSISVAMVSDNAIGGLESEVLPGGLFATAAHIGPYAHIGLTAHGLLTWCAERGVTPVGNIREVYMTNPNDYPPAQLVTELMIHVEDHDDG